MASCQQFLDKVVVVTGASSGLGEATAVLFAQRGASVVLCGRDQDRLQSALSKCVEASDGQDKKFITVAGNLLDAASRQNIMDKTIEAFGHLDVLVANAGVGLPKGNIEEATEEIFDEIFNTNVKATFFLIQAALPHLEKSGGNVVNVSSITSVMPLGRSVLYPMSKATVDHMTRCLSLDLAPKGIRVNAVNPSYVPTRIHRSFGAVEDMTKLALAQESKKQPLYGQCVTAEDVAKNIAFLASDDAKFITGQCNIIDGARHFVGPF